MLFERIESKGLAHYSYLIGSEGRAVVIDPRRDCSVYVDKALRSGHRITHILETHRNEDYLIGSVALASRTGATICHADAQWDYQYGQPVEDGQTWGLGAFELEAIHSPGHTPGMMSYLLRDRGGAPWMVFTGDSLFAGDVGRMDLLGEERMEEMAGKMYETLFQKLLPLGDEVIVCPAHGPGSVCGSAIADRAWTTIGLERKHNPKLQFDSEENFVANVAQMLDRPPYFHKMEAENLEGATLPEGLPAPQALPPREFILQAEKAVVLDTRMELGFGAAHVPSAISIWKDGVASFAGWFLPYDRPILLVNERDDPTQIMRYLVRLGYDDVEGYLGGGMLSWHKAGKISHAIDTITVHNLCDRLDAGEEFHILDVRSDEELESQGEIPTAQHISVVDLPERMDQVPRGGRIYVFCGSGVRSMMAASLLERQGYADLVVVLGGVAGWSSTACPISL